LFAWLAVVIKDGCNGKVAIGGAERRVISNRDKLIKSHVIGGTPNTYTHVRAMEDLDLNLQSFEEPGGLVNVPPYGPNP
jgi:hypothetical protein